MSWTEHVTAAVHASIVVPAAAEPVVSFVLVTYGTGAIIEECLAALAGSLVDEGLPYEVIVVDNAYPSGMSPADRLLLATSGVRVIASDRNLGFGGGNDIGVAHARAGVVCLMNPDLVVAAGWLRPLLEAVADAGVGIAAPVLLDPDGALQEAGQVVDGRAFTLPAEREPGGATIDVDHSSAACWMVRAEVLEAVGGFDPAYHPAYFEDVDLVWRVRRAGLRTVLVGASRVVHVRGTSTRRRPTTVVSQQAVFRRRWRAELARRA